MLEAGEYDRASDVLGAASERLRIHSRVREGLQVLVPFLAEPIRVAMEPARVGRILGTVGLAYAALGQVERAIEWLDRALRIEEEIKDPLITRFCAAKREQLRSGAGEDWSGAAQGPR